MEWLGEEKQLGAIRDRAAAPVWGFTRGTTGSSGSLSCGAREVRSPCAWRGGTKKRPFILREVSQPLPTPQYQCLLRGTMSNSLRSPAQVEGTQGILPQPEKDLKSPSSTRLEDGPQLEKRWFPPLGKMRPLPSTAHPPALLKLLPPPPGP